MGRRTGHVVTLPPVVTVDPLERASARDARARLQSQATASPVDAAGAVSSQGRRYALVGPEPV